MLIDFIKKSPNPSRMSLELAILCTGWIPIAILFGLWLVIGFSLYTLAGGTVGAIFALTWMNAVTSRHRVTTARDTEGYALQHEDGAYRVTYTQSLYDDMWGVPLFTLLSLCGGSLCGYIISLSVS
jgi:hypothetical protein